MDFNDICWVVNFSGIEHCTKQQVFLFKKKFITDISAKCSTVTFVICLLYPWKMKPNKDKDGTLEQDT